MVDVKGARMVDKTESTMAAWKDDHLVENSVCKKVDGLEHYSVANLVA